jgi:RNA polymerase sigma factor (TIGR02999 family)
VINPDITRLLHAWRDGDAEALEQLVPSVYDELRRIARQHMRRELPECTLQPTALVNEVYLRLQDARRIDWLDRSHFFAVASRIMRRVLVDAARSRRADKRGGGAARAMFEEALNRAGDRGIDLTALDEALAALEREHPRKARVVEMRVFGGLGVAEIAGLLGVSTYTVTRDWTFAKTWLKAELFGTQIRSVPLS